MKEQVMIIKSQRRKARTRKVQKKFLRTEDDDEDFIPQLVGAGLTYFGSQMAKPGEYDIGSSPQMQNWENKADAYMSNVGDYRDSSLQFMDPGSQINQQLRRTMGDQSMDQLGILNMLNRRNNPGVASGIMNAQNTSQLGNTLNQNNQNFQGALMQNYNTGFGGLGNAMNFENTGVQQYGGIAENYAQQGIANQNNMNQYDAGMGGLISQVGMGMFGGGPT